MRLRTLFIHSLIILLPFALTYYRAEQPILLDNQANLLMNNTGALLGDAQIERTIDSLINRLLWDEDSSGTKRRWTAAMAVLAEIDPQAVPKLIDAILSAPIRAAAIKYGDDSTPSEFMVRCFTANLQVRAAMVLGFIGDSRALPVLTNLECQTGSIDCYYIQEAIRAILVRVSRGR